MTDEPTTTPAADRNRPRDIRDEAQRYREQRDEARREVDRLRKLLDVADRIIQHQSGQRDDALAKLASVEAAISPWPPGPRKGDVLRAIGGER